jgi:Sec-independent protein translocase protein TatA
MFDIGPEKFLFVLVVAFLLLGPEQLPDLARKLGTTMRHWHSLRDSLQSQVHSVLDVPTIEPRSGSEAIEPDADHSIRGDFGTGPASFS